MDVWDYVHKGTYTVQWNDVVGWLVPFCLDPSPVKIDVTRRVGGCGPETATAKPAMTNIILTESIPIHYLTFTWIILFFHSGTHIRLCIEK